MKAQNKTQSDSLRQWLQPALDLAVTAVNYQRRQSGPALDYILLALPSALPLLPEPRNLLQRQILGAPALSLAELEQALRRIGDDPRPQGVILHLRGLSMSLADLQMLRGMLQRLQARGKRLICYAARYDMPCYYVASLADEIVLQPGGALVTTGLVQQQFFLREALDTIGLQADVVAISPYKSAADTLMRREPSPEEAAMTNWLLDSRFAMLVEDIAAGRGLPVAAVQALIDRAPYTDQEAREAGYVDALLPEEKLYDHLQTAHIVPWEEADKTLPLRLPPLSGPYVGVLPLSGNIIDGESSTPPVDIPIPFVGGERIGDVTVVRQVRNMMQDDRLAALVLLIDSGGGSATASEAMAAALDELAKTRPVVACLHSVAASGGYYIATPAEHIIAQPGTITGSIGVFGLKLVNNEALRKLRFNPVTYLRGENAGMFTAGEPFTPYQREKMQLYIERVYEQFTGRVADARKLKREQVDAVGGGRVWTGQQALAHGLIDAHGGLYEALQQARQLAGLPENAPALIWRGRGKPLAAQVADRLNPAAALRYWQDNLAALSSGQAQMLMPYEWRF
ncbi:MAG: S49 family peptidase [Anaerolineae bacterium]|jgi:protease-4|nr:S49 family peptidase [Anaerolineae bacterium]